MPARLRTIRTTTSPLSLSTWLSRHQLISVALTFCITIVVGWSAARGHSGARLIAYVAPLLIAGAIATRAEFSQTVRSCALVFGLFTGAALVAELAEGSVIAPVGYFLALCLASLYERRAPLVLGLALVFVHEAIFGTVIPDGAPIDGLPHWVTTVLFGASFFVAAAVLTVPWGTNDDDRVRARRQLAQIDDQLAVSEILVAVDVPGRVTMISDHGCRLLGRERADVIGEDWFDLVAEPHEREAARAGHHALTHPDGAPISAPQFFQFEHAIIVADGSRRIFQWRATVSLEGDAVIGTVAAGLDITETRQAQRQLLREQRDLVQLQQIAQAVARETDARESVVEGIGTLVDANLAGLMEPTAGGDELILTRSTRPEFLGTRIALDGTPSGNGVAYKSGEPFFVADAKGHPLIQQHLVELTGSQSFLYQPVLVEGRVAAVLVVGWAERVDDLGSRKTNLVELAADEAASALQRLAAMRRWEEAALTDVLTGVPNRRAFDHMFDDALKAAEASGQPLALALMDLNGFKALNDTEGHAAGDRVLKESAALWLQELRPTDVLARLGGDEFAVLLPNCGAKDIVSVAERLRRALRHEAGCGVGIEVWNREESGSSLMHRADESLYTDKAVRGARSLSDPRRLAAVEATGFLYPGTDERLDQLAETVTVLLGVPVSLISLVDDTRQNFAGQCGLGLLGVEEPDIPLSHSFCKHPVATAKPLVINDVAAHPLVSDVDTDEVVPAGSPIGAYAGMPIIDRHGFALGSVCAVDTQARNWSEDELATRARRPPPPARATELITAGVRR
jgi:diguanylate cyclase (GGDEF)-like protein/PAS domain S-box-containing protein